MLRGQWPLFCGNVEEKRPRSSLHPTSVYIRGGATCRLRATRPGVINSMFGDPCSQRVCSELTGTIGVDVVQGELPALRLDPEVLDCWKYFRSFPASEGLGKV